MRKRNSGETAEANILQYYLDEVGRYPLISREEERSLFKQYAADGNPRVREKLLNSNLRFVVKKAVYYHQISGFSLIDLISAGNEGLAIAFDKFNYKREVKFITYAAWWIWAYMQSAVKEGKFAVTVGTDLASRKGMFGKDKGDFYISQESLDQPVGDGTRDTRMDRLVDERDLQEELLGDEQVNFIVRMILPLVRNVLDERETFILENRVLAENPMVRPEIRKIFNVTAERLRQIEIGVVAKATLVFRDAGIPSLKVLEDYMVVEEDF